MKYIYEYQYYDFIECQNSIREKFLTVDIGLGREYATTNLSHVCDVVTNHVMCQFTFFKEQYVCLLANFFLTRKGAMLKSFSTFYDLYFFAGDDDDGRCVDVV